MGLSGTFDTMPFPDLMQWLGETGQRGMLTVTLVSSKKALDLVVEPRGAWLICW